MSSKTKTRAEREGEATQAEPPRIGSINEPPGSNVMAHAMPEAPAHTVSHIDPADAQIGSPDVVLHVYGTNFRPDAQIVFNGGLEPTEYISTTELTTVVKPSTASVPGSYPVSVVQDDFIVEPAQMFAFTEQTEVPTSSRRGRR